MNFNYLSLRIKLAKYCVITIFHIEICLRTLQWWKLLPHLDSSFHFWLYKNELIILILWPHLKSTVCGWFNNVGSSHLVNVFPMCQALFQVLQD